MSASVDLDAFFNVLANLLDYSCVEEAEYQGQRRWVEQMLADADSATPALKKHADDQLKRLGQLARNIGKALDALDAIDPALAGLLAAQAGDLAQFREHAARIKTAAGPGSLAAHCAALPRKRWPSQGGVDCPLLGFKPSSSRRNCFSTKANRCMLNSLESWTPPSGEKGP